MNDANHTASFGTLFSTLAALTSPAQEFVTSRPAYRERAAAAAARRLPAARSGRALAALAAPAERARVRRALERLDDRLLRDIGLSRAEVERGPAAALRAAGGAGLRALGRDLAGALMKRLKHNACRGDISRKQTPR